MDWPRFSSIAAPCVLILALAPCARGTGRNDAALWRPRFATPAILALDQPTNRQFTAELRAPASARKWSVTISNDLRSWQCPVSSARYAKINQGREPGWQINA